MKEKNYKLVLLGIDEEFNEDEVKEKLGRIFQRTPKQIDKLLKKPSVLRAKLDHRTAQQYQQGLERIGALSHVEDNRGVVIDMHTVETFSPEEAEEELQFKPDEPIENVVLDSSDTLRVVRIQMSFNAIAKFLLKCLFAAIPAILLYMALMLAIRYFLGDILQPIL